MAGNAKPSSELIEARYKVLDGYPQSNTNNLTGLFDGVFSTSAGYYGGLTYGEIGWVEIQLLEPGVFYRYVGVGPGPSSNFQILKNKNGQYIDVSDTFLIDDNAATGGKWYLFTNPMPPGIYKFIGKTINSSYDMEWFIEKSKYGNFLILDNGTYRTYDSDNNSLIEFTDNVSEIFNENSTANFITDLNNIKDLLLPGMKIISNMNFSINATVIKSTKQLLLANGDFSTKLASNIDWFKFNYDISANCCIKILVSIDSGLSWYSYIEGNWTQLDIKVPLKEYDELSDIEKDEWNAFLDNVLEKGMNIQNINELDFNLLNSEKIRFAYAIQIEDANSEAILKDLKWQFDSIGSYIQMNPKTEVNISMTNEAIKIQPLKNIELMKINVGISSQVPQVFDTSGLLDKETFKGKEINSVKLADKARSLEPNLSQIDGTRKYYGVDNNDGEMKLRTFPAGTHTEHVDTYIFDNLTKDVPQTIPFVEERPEVNVMPAVFKYREGLKNQESILEKYSNDNITIKRNSAECTEEGIGIKDKYNINNNIDNDIYKYPISGFDSIKNINSYRDLTRNTNFVKWRNSYTLNENSVVITNTSSASGGFLYLNEPLDKDKELNVSFDFNISSSYENTSGSGVGLLFASTLDHKSNDTTYYNNPSGVYGSVAITCASNSDQRLRIKVVGSWGSTSISKGVTHNLKIKIKDKKIYVWIDNNLEINGIDYSSIIDKITDVYYACLYINSYTKSSIITFSNVHINDMYILEKDNKYYSLLQTNYDADTKSYKEIEDLSSDNMNDYCIMDSDTLTKEVTINDETFKPLDKFNDFKLVSLYGNNEIRLDAIKSNKEMIISTQNLSLLSANRINTFKQVISKVENGNCKTVFSLDNGVSWKSYDTSTSQFIDLTNTFPLDDIDNLDPDNLSEENKTKWDNLQDEIIEKGIDADTMQTLDFATLLGHTYKNIRFAHVLIRPTYDDKVTLQNMSWNVDEEGDYVQTNDIEVAVNSNRLTVTSKENLQNVKVNLLI